MKRDYTHISTEELLQDDFFISSIINPTEETQIFWECRLADGNIDPEIFCAARNILLSLNRPPHRTFPKNVSKNSGNASRVQCMVCVPRRAAHRQRRDGCGRPHW